jgi:hypothetical protein
MSPSQGEAQVKFIDVRNAETEEQLFVNPNYVAVIEQAHRGFYRLVITLGTSIRSVLVNKDDALKVVAEADHVPGISTSGVMAVNAVKLAQ